MKIRFRTPRPDEAADLWEMMNALDNETKFMMYEPGERKRDIRRMTKLIAGGSADDYLMAAYDKDRIIGYISAQRGAPRRIRHSAYIVVGVKSAYRGIGIGTELFRGLIEWADRNGIVRLELTVMCHNQAALHLYEKAGFAIEGTRRYSLIIDGQYAHEYYMSRIRPE